MRQPSMIHPTLDSRSNNDPNPVDLELLLPVVFDIIANSLATAQEIVSCTSLNT